MSALTHTLTHRALPNIRLSGLFKKVSAASLANAFWFATSLLLSLIMGPFAAIPAVIAVFTCNTGMTGEPEPETN